MTEFRQSSNPSSKAVGASVEALPGKARFGVLVNLGAGEPAIEQQRQIEAASTTLNVSAMPVAVERPMILMPRSEHLRN